VRLDETLDDAVPIGDWVQCACLRHSRAGARLPWCLPCRSSRNSRNSHFGILRLCSWKSRVRRFGSSRSP
jgi:hypothetical protein